MRVVVLGAGNAFSALQYSSSFAVEHHGVWLLVDCPHPMRRMLAEARVSCPDLPDVDGFAATVITHAHADHCGGLEGVGYFNHFVKGVKTPVVAHPRVMDSVWEGHLRAGMEEVDAETTGSFEMFYTGLPLLPGVPVTVGPFTIHGRITRHPVLTLGLKIAVDGAMVAYSADTEEDPTHLEWLSEADLVLHEAGTGIHTPVEFLEEAPPGLRERLHLLHYPDTISADTTSLNVLTAGDVLEVR